MNSIDPEILRIISHMPFLDRMEASAVSRWSASAVYNAFSRMERLGLVESVSHATEHVPSTRRYCLTADGLKGLSGDEGRSVNELLHSRPVSNWWRRLLLGRLDAVAAIYRLVTFVSPLSRPIRFRWYRALPMDAAIALPDGRVISIVRQGPTTDRTGFSKRLWRLMVGHQHSVALLLMPDETRLRYARKLLTEAPFIAYFALEQEVVHAGAGSSIWRTSTGHGVIDLGTVLDLAGPRGALPKEEPLMRASLPASLSTCAGEDWLLSSLLRPVEKRALDSISDWPWITHTHLGALMSLKRSRLYEIVGRLRSLGLVSEFEIEGGRRLAVTDRGLAMLARRDRASVGAAKKRWSAVPLHANSPFTWRNVAGRRIRQLLRNLDHTTAVHGFIAALSRQARSLSWQVANLDPPSRASRYFQHADRLRSIHPDAFGVLQGGISPWLFFLEWERRAVRPVTMAARLAPYLRYYSSHQPTDDHGSRPDLLIVLQDDLASRHLLRIAREEVTRAAVELPLLVSHRALIEREGPLGRAWFTEGSTEPGYALEAL